MVNGLNENDVIDAVCNFLESEGFEISQRLATTQTGEDIVARHGQPPHVTFSIEAKGTTSARKGSPRYGLPFKGSQVRSHVAKAVFKAVQVLAGDGNGLVRAGIA